MVGRHPTRRVGTRGKCERVALARRGPVGTGSAKGGRESHEQGSPRRSFQSRGAGLPGRQFRRHFEQLEDVGLDILVHWPYDEGGCSCERCRPWGSNGYLRFARDLTRLGRDYFARLESVSSTWMFDTPPEGEWAGLTDAVARDPSWVDSILADAHEDYPRYPLDVVAPGGLPWLSFPEISMWGNSPWGGYGANPLPGRYQRRWNQVSHRVSGGFPYSEGIYEDINKAVVAPFY